jgi:DNA-binding beta-propeller fold protein YncE
MNRREFSQFAAAGVASMWLPACSGAPGVPGEPPAAGTSGARGPGASPVGAPGESQLAAGSGLRSFAPDGRSFEASPIHNYVDLLAPSGRRTARIGDPSRVPTRAVGDVSGPVAIAWDDAAQRLIVLERGNERIQAFDGAGASLGVLAEGVVGSDLFVRPDDGTIYVAACLDHSVAVFSASGRSLGTVGRFGTDDAGLNGPLSVVASADGTVHVVDAGSARVKVFGADGRFQSIYGAASAAGGGASALVGPRAVRLDAAGRSWVADTFGAAVCVYDGLGSLLSRFSPRLSDGTPAAPVSLCARADGTVYASLIAAA